MSPGIPVRFDLGRIDRHDPSIPRVSQTLIYRNEGPMKQGGDPSVSETSRHREDPSIPEANKYLRDPSIRGTEPGKGNRVNLYA